MKEHKLRPGVAELASMVYLFGLVCEESAVK